MVGNEGIAITVDGGGRRESIREYFIGPGPAAEEFPSPNQPSNSTRPNQSAPAPLLFVVVSRFDSRPDRLIQRSDNLRVPPVVSLRIFPHDFHSQPPRTITRY